MPLGINTISAWLTSYNRTHEMGLVISESWLDLDIAQMNDPPAYIARVSTTSLY